MGNREMPEVLVLVLRVLLVMLLVMLLTLAARPRARHPPTNPHGLVKSKIFDLGFQGGSRRNPTSTAPTPLEIEKSKIVDVPKP
jgi:hypothetical protein